MSRTTDAIRLLHTARTFVEAALDLIELDLDENRISTAPRRQAKGKTLIPTELDIARARRALRGLQ